MQKFLFQFSSLLAVSGMVSAVFGLIAEQAKLIVTGFILLFGAGVFAMLYSGTRRASQSQAGNNPQGTDDDTSR